jgi:hypothetical protein
MKIGLQLAYKVVSNYNVGSHTSGLTGALLAVDGAPRRYFAPGATKILSEL